MDSLGPVPVNGRLPSGLATPFAFTLCKYIDLEKNGILLSIIELYQQQETYASQSARTILQMETFLIYLPENICFLSFFDAFDFEFSRRSEFV